MKLLLKIFLTAILPLALAATAPANAGVILDQDATVYPTTPLVYTPVGTYPPGTIPGDPIQDAYVVQTVTAGQKGQLAGIDIQGVVAFGSSGTVRVSLFDGNVGAGPATLIGAGEVAAANLPPFIFIHTGVSSLFDTSSFNFEVKPGQIFSFMVELLDSENTALLIPSGNFLGFDGGGKPVFVKNQYAGGQVYYTTKGVTAGTEFDLGFRTYVDVLDTTAVPEPATWAMMLLGFGAIGGSLRIRRNSRTGLHQHHPILNPV